MWKPRGARPSRLAIQTVWKDLLSVSHHKAHRVRALLPMRPESNTWRQRLLLMHLASEQNMNLYLAFGLDIGNVGRAKATRPPTKALVADWNKRLSSSREVHLQFINAYAHTGNYVLQASKSEQLENIMAVLDRFIPTYKFAVFSYMEFLAVLDPIRRALKQTPPAVSGRRWTPGIVMDTNPNGRIPLMPASDAKAWFGAFAVPRSLSDIDPRNLLHWAPR